MLRIVVLTVTLAAAAPTPWTWPATPVHIVRPYQAPVHAYGAGHRGIDLAAGPAVVSPDDGAVAFVGVVAGRPLITIDHGEGVVSTLEPVLSGLRTGDAVSRGQVVGAVAVGGHAEAGTVHVGARVDGEYVNPLRFLGGVPRAVLLPCCDQPARLRAP